MLFFKRWQTVTTLLVSFFFCAMLIPNMLSPETRQSLPTFLQRTMTLGLDLQGGSHILLEVDAKAIQEERIATLRDDVRRVLRDARVGYTGLTSRDLTVQVRVREAKEVPDALTKLRELSTPITGVFGPTGTRDIDPSFVVTHVMSLDDAPKAYDMFKKKKDGCIKVVLKPGLNGSNGETVH